ncbi:Imidazolonepropionase [Paraburkholderia aspalathi]|nr:Imidazolonepropionase [Paraburkholderia aspalathi]CAE6872897.1 Imidazolonepropionase [Paraburkholderia aspalathi]
MSYEEIARRGGGIVSTVRATHEASEDALFAQSAAHLEALLAEGVTAVEINSGYGRPEDGIHALQLELSQRTYMDEEMPYAYDETRASKVGPLLELLVSRAVEAVRRTKT